MGQEAPLSRAGSGSSGLTASRAFVATLASHASSGSMQQDFPMSRAGSGGIPGGSFGSRRLSSHGSDTFCITPHFPVSGPLSPAVPSQQPHGPLSHGSKASSEN
ncbi:hypothetical protein WJX84_006345 [Apatococcus fuscideae]|uniref:Uncharacterized protein n=1 Tax=Apatococcus fuscideae TaxID=2026836 RepID=A0AAW1T3L0_9CHLO